MDDPEAPTEPHELTTEVRGEDGLTVSERADVARNLTRYQIRKARVGAAALDAMPELVGLLNDEIREEAKKPEVKERNMGAVREDGKLLLAISRIAEKEERPDEDAAGGQHLHVHMTPEQWAEQVAAIMASKKGTNGHASDGV